MMTSSKAILPDVPEMKDGWRVACIAYRGVRQKGGADLPAYVGALAALRMRLPELSPREAAEQTRTAIYFASSEHPKWFWNGVGEPPSGSRK